MPEISKLLALKEKQPKLKVLQHNNNQITLNRKNKKFFKFKSTTMVKNKIKPKTSNKRNKSNNHFLKNAKIIETKKVDLLQLQPVQKRGRQTNNSLASAIGQIVIDACDRVTDTENKKGSEIDKNNVSAGYDYSFKLGIEEEEQQVGMHKVLNILKEHEDAWPFNDPVDEQYAPRYYSVVRYPMDFSTMEEKLEEGSYKTINQFKRDFRLIIDNCRQYNGSDNEYTEMAMNLQEVFKKAIYKYLENEQSSDDSSSVTSGVDVSSVNSKNKNVSQFVICHSQRHKHTTKLNKKSKVNRKVNSKKKSRQSFDEYVKENSETETKQGKTKIKKIQKIFKKYESKINKEENNEELKNEASISDTNIVNLTKKHAFDIYKSVANKKKNLVKEKIEKEVIKTNEKIEKEYKQNVNKESVAVKKFKENRKRKKDFKEENESTMILKTKFRRIDKKPVNNKINLALDKSKKNKVKDIYDKSLDTDKNTILFNVKGKKHGKASEKNSNLFHKKNKTKEKKLKKKKYELLSKIELKTLSNEKNVASLMHTNEFIEKKIEPSNKDIESLDSLKDRISEKHRKEQLKSKKDKNKKQLFESDEHYDSSKKVPSNNINTRNYGDKIDVKKIQLKKLKIEKCSDNQSQKNDESEPKKIHNKNFKRCVKKDLVIQKLNKATEKTLNDINKWLDDAPCLTEFSLSNDSRGSLTPTNDSLQLTVIKQHVSTETAETGFLTNTGSSAIIDHASRKRTNSQKLLVTQNQVKLKKVQRTISRLQPGKSKGNLLSKKTSSVESGSISDVTINKSLADNNQLNYEVINEPKLSLGTVLKNVDSIQLICKSLVPSPNNIEDDDNNESVNSKKLTILSKKIINELSASKQNKSSVNVIEKERILNQLDIDEPQKLKSATPNLSAWFKAFGTPKIKKKEEEDDAIKKDESSESTGVNNITEDRQRRMSTGGSSVSESVSSFSQESPPSRVARSPQQISQIPNVVSSPVFIESQIHSAGFYQDALSTNSSPYNSPYYTTPPRYSAQLPPTPSPQHNPLSPVCHSSFEHAGGTVPSPNLYSQISPQSHQSLPNSSPQRQSPKSFSSQSSQNCRQQNSPHSESQKSYTMPQNSASDENQSSVYNKQSSPTSLQSSPYTQLSTKVANHSQSSPKSPTPVYSQLSPKMLSSNYSKPSSSSPSSSQPTSLGFSQSSPQQHSTYSQSSPQIISTYSQSTHQLQSSLYSQPSSQQTSFLQLPSRPLTSTYSRQSPQQPNYSVQTTSLYSQPDLVIVQASSQTQSYSDQPKQQPSYSPSLTQTSYSVQTSPQNQSLINSQPSPQTHQNYSQPISQQVSPMSQIQPTVDCSQTLSNQSVQQQHQQEKQQTVTSGPNVINKNCENLSENLLALSFNQLPKSYVSTSTNISTLPIKTFATKTEQSQHQQNVDPNLVSPNQLSSYSFAVNAKYQASCPSNFSASNHSPNQSMIKSTMSKVSGREAQQPIQQKEIEPNQEQQSQLMNFQKNLACHDSLYASSFQTSSYSVPNTTCHPSYPSYFDSNIKNTSVSLSCSNLTPVKKRMYNETSTPIEPVIIQANERTNQEQQFGFDTLVSLARSQSDDHMTNQIDNTFNCTHNLADSVAVTQSPVYARLQLGLVNRNSKDAQQMLSIPRQQNKSDSIVTYTCNSTVNQSDLDLNLLPSLHSTSTKNSNIISVPRKLSDHPTQVTSVTKSKKSKKNKQQQLNTSFEQQISISSFSQYGDTSDSLGLKQSRAGSNTFNFSPATNSSLYEKETSTSVAAAAYAFLDDFRNPNLPTYYSMALRQQQQQHQHAAAVVQQRVKVTGQQLQKQQNQLHVTSESTQQIKLNNQTTAASRNYSNHTFLHSTQRSNPYTPPVPTYMTPHGSNLSVDPTAYQQYLHSLYALQPPPHHRPSWI